MFVNQEYQFKVIHVLKLFLTLRTVYSKETCFSFYMGSVLHIHQALSKLMVLVGHSLTFKCHFCPFLCIKWTFRQWPLFQKTSHICLYLTCLAFVSCICVLVDMSHLRWNCSICQLLIGQYFDTSRKFLFTHCGIHRIFSCPRAPLWNP